MTAALTTESAVFMDTVSFPEKRPCWRARPTCCTQGRAFALCWQDPPRAPSTSLPNHLLNTHLRHLNDQGLNVPSFIHLKVRLNNALDTTCVFAGLGETPPNTGSQSTPCWAGTLVERGWQEKGSAGGPGHQPQERPQWEVRLEQGLAGPGGPEQIGKWGNSNDDNNDEWWLLRRAKPSSVAGRGGGALGESLECHPTASFGPNIQ